MSRALTLQQLWDLETRFDEASPLAGRSPFLPLLEAVRSARWADSYAEADLAFLSSFSALEKAFALQWAVVAAELQYDLEVRSQWMARWKEIDGWAEEAYCRYLRMYQEALTRFFEGSLQDAEARFQKAFEIAQGTGYERGQMRCLFHLGLVQRDKSRLDRAAEFFQAALAFARSRKAHSYEARILDQLNRIGQDAQSLAGSSSERRKTEIEKCLLGRRFPEARALIIEGETARRRAGLRRGRESYFIYLPFFLFSRNRELAASRMLHRIADPLLKIRVLELKGRIFGFTAAEERELRALREIHGVSTVMIRASGPASAEVCGISLSEVPDQEIRLLMELLLETEKARSGNLTKEVICSRLWRYSYDPTVHDGRIYKLIHRTRKFFGRKDLFLNTYGGYRLNPKFLGASSAGAFPIACTGSGTADLPLARRKSS